MNQHLKVMKLLITQCPDRMFWYRDLVGQFVPFEGIWPESGYKSREVEGHANVVRFEDAVIYAMGKRYKLVES